MQMNLPWNMIEGSAINVNEHIINNIHYSKPLRGYCIKITFRNSFPFNMSNLHFTMFNVLILDNI